MIVFSSNLPIFFFSKSERKLESKHETLGALVICCLIRICCFLLFLFFVSLFSLSFSDTHLFFFFFFFVFLLWILSFSGTFYLDFLIFMFIFFNLLWFFLVRHFLLLLICNFFYLFNTGMRVNLNKLYFSSSHFSSQPSKRVFHSSIFLPSTKHHKTKTNISSISHFFISSPFSIFLHFNILNQVNLIVSSFRLYCQM